MAAQPWPDPPREATTIVRIVTGGCQVCDRERRNLRNAGEQDEEYRSGLISRDPLQRSVKD
ncbi:MAG TPA: hypothetical protein VF516_20375, partial [Kofleriaceae bacterium]